MSEADRDKWNNRYKARQGEGLAPPSPWLVTHLPKIAPGAALDLACGRGRNALLLARSGFTVDAIDISAEGLRQARQAAQRAGVQVSWLCEDVLEDAELPRRDYQLIVMVHFLAPALLKRLPGYLAPGGWLLVEEHLRWPSPVEGPSERFRVGPGELVASVPDLTLVAMAEGEVLQPGGVRHALSRMLVKKPG